MKIVSIVPFIISLAAVMVIIGWIGATIGGVYILVNFQMYWKLFSKCHSL